MMESPGQHARHYAPRTPLYMSSKRVSKLPPGRGVILDLPPEREAYAANLYAVLHAADKEGWDWIARD